VRRPLVLSILDDLKPVFEVLTPAGGGWARARITGLPDLGTAHVWSFDAYPEESNGDLLAPRTIRSPRPHCS
jgi:prolyl oligopeptidase